MFSRCVPPESGAHAASASLRSICHVTLNNLIHLHKGGMNFKKSDRRELCGFKCHSIFSIKVSKCEGIGENAECSIKGKGDEQANAICKWWDIGLLCNNDDDDNNECKLHTEIKINIDPVWSLAQNQINFLYFQCTHHYYVILIHYLSSVFTLNYVTMAEVDDSKCLHFCRYWEVTFVHWKIID